SRRCSTQGSHRLQKQRNEATSWRSARTRQRHCCWKNWEGENMAREDNAHLRTEQPADELSPVKRALGEIRRLRAELEDLRRGSSEPVAIIGLAVRLPGGVTS